MAKIKVVGMEKLQKKLKKNVDMTEVKRKVRKHGGQLQEKAMRNAPVDTGFLKQHINLDIGDGGMSAEVEPTADYAPYVELGTRFMEAQPYLKPAFDEQKEKFKKDMQKLVK